MTKPKTLEQLRAEKERAETQLAQEKHKLNRLENRKKYLEKGEGCPPSTPDIAGSMLEGLHALRSVNAVYMASP